MHKLIFVVVCTSLVISSYINISDNDISDEKNNKPSNDELIIESSEVLQPTINDNLTTYVKENMYSVFPMIEGFVWYYEGPNDTELVSIIDKIEKYEDRIVLIVANCREDLTGEELLQNRISYKTVEVYKNKIVMDNSVILKEPLVLGNKWETDYVIKPTNKKSEASIEIIENNDKTITTKVKVDIDDNGIKQNYEELVTYELGRGITSEWYEIIGIDSYSRGLNLVETYEQPAVKDKWYLSPYEIEQYEINIQQHLIANDKP